VSGIQQLLLGGAPSAAYQIERSLRFNSADTAYLNRTPASAGNRRKWTWSGWVKRSALTSFQVIEGVAITSGISEESFVFDAADKLAYRDGITGDYSVTAAVFRDIGAWYHVLFIYDSDNATQANRGIFYVNGVQQTNSTNAIPLNRDSYINSTNAHALGRFAAVASNYFNGYLTEINFIDGYAYDPSYFGQTNAQTGVWEPKAYTGSYGTNGFFLKFADNSNTTAATLGKDSSGNGNNWTPNNFSVTAGAGNDSLVDTPTSYGTDTGAGGEVRGNYCTWNPLDKDDGITSVTEGNLKVVTNGSNGSIKSTIAFPSGKWYWEVTSDTINSSGTQAVGIIPQSQPPTNNMSDSGKLGYALDVSFSDRKFENGTATSYGTYTQANGAIYMLAFDQDAGKLWYGINGTWLASGAPASGTNPSSSSISTSTAYCAAVSDNTVSGTFTANFGQRPFAYTAPSGFKALCTQNLPTPTIGATSTTQAGKFFNVVLYTGTGSSQGITGVGFQPDWVWIKGRSGATDHGLYDAVRGVQLQLESNTTTAETTETTGLTAFGTDGFTVGALAQLNTNNDTYVAWNWNAGGSNATNTSGTITSTVRASTTAGFSIVTYTGTGSAATVGHGIGTAPTFIIVKRRNSSTTWPCLVKAANSGNGQNGRLNLNETAPYGDNIEFWNNTAPTSTVFSVRDHPTTNASGGTYVAYCFAPIAGYSAFSSYIGNGSTDGPFVYTGFRPRWILIKNSTTGGNAWVLHDTALNTYNVSENILIPNTTGSVSTSSSYNLDINSNGFKLRNAFDPFNLSANTYIYAAFAEFPFKFSLAR